LSKREDQLTEFAQTVRMRQDELYEQHVPEGEWLPLNIGMYMAMARVGDLARQMEALERRLENKDAEPRLTAIQTRAAMTDIEYAVAALCMVRKRLSQIGDQLVSQVQSHVTVDRVSIQRYNYIKRLKEIERKSYNTIAELNERDALRRRIPALGPQKTIAQTSDDQWLCKREKDGHWVVYEFDEQSFTYQSRAAMPPSQEDADLVLFRYLSVAAGAENWEASLEG
jgi:hypothetical protein